MYELSLLKENILLISEEGTLLTVQVIERVLKEESVEIEFETYYKDEVLNEEWFIAKEDDWEIDARQMLKNHLQDSFNVDTAPGWIQSALEAMESIDFKKIQSIIMEQMKKVDGVSKFYIKGEKVNIK
ncbi:hypothetical protein [Bacillus cereus]|uniref:hypothetical protein n=1 Tax=Bacillus cereus TaxID=1396 RepID=UPI000B4B51E0|nr:hypothetical protein [Bacillus cereus]